MKSNIEYLYEELRKATDGGSESMTHDDALKQIALKLEQPAQGPEYRCKGVPRKGCNYLSPCYGPCNKCGHTHNPLKLMPAPTQPAQSEVKSLEQAIAQERTNPCDTCKHRSDGYDDVCPNCCNFYANHWEPKP